MPVESIEIPESCADMSIAGIQHSPEAAAFIDTANERIEAFMLADQKVIENFVTCDFHLTDQALAWITQNHLLTGNRFCELGSGFGVVAMLAAIRGMESIGIEIEEVLVQQSAGLAEDLDINAKFYTGSFVPRGVSDDLDLGQEINHVDTSEDDVFDEVGLAMDDFDLFFAFPWPGEHVFFEAVFETCAADGSLLLTYQGREGMRLVRKI